MGRIAAKGDAGKEFGLLSHNQERDGKGMWALAACWDTSHVSSTARERLPIGRGWGIAEVIVMPREISRGSDVLGCPGRFRRTPLLLFPADLLLSPSFSIASACWGGTSGSSKALFKILDGRAVNGP